MQIFLGFKFLVLNNKYRINNNAKVFVTELEFYCQKKHLKNLTHSQILQFNFAKPKATLNVPCCSSNNKCVVDAELLKAWEIRVRCLPHETSRRKEVRVKNTKTI